MRHEERRMLISKLAKTGETVQLSEYDRAPYLFLGFITSDFRRCMVADRHGNKIETVYSNIKRN